MTDELLVDIGLKAAYEQAKSGCIKDLKLTQEEAAEYWFNIGFKMGHRFARFVDEAKLGEKTNAS